MWALAGLKILTLMSYVCQYHIKFQLKKCRRVISHDTEEWLKLEKLTFCLKNDMRNLMDFNSSSEKSENLHFDGDFLLKVYNVWAKIIEMSCVEKNDLWLQKWLKEFGEFSHK